MLFFKFYFLLYTFFIHIFSFVQILQIFLFRVVFTSRPLNVLKPLSLSVLNKVRRKEQENLGSHLGYGTIQNWETCESKQTITHT